MKPPIITDLQLRFQELSVNRRTNETTSVPREWSLKALSRATMIAEVQLESMLVPRWGFFLHGTKWTYNPLAEEMAEQNEKIGVAA